MTPEERDRLVRLEENMKSMQKDVTSIKQSMSTIEKGSLYLKGALFVVAALGAFVGWVLDRIIKVWPHVG